MAIDYSKVLDGKEAKPDQTKQVANPFDLRVARDTFSLIIKGFDEMKSKMKGFEIKTGEDAVTMTEMLGQLATLKKRLKAKSDQLVEKPYEFYKSVRNLFGTPISEIEQMIREGKNKIGAHERAEKIKRIEAERLAQEEHEKRQARLFDAAKGSGIPKKDVTLEKPVFPKKSKPIRTETGSASVKMKKLAIVADPKKVPTEYLVIDWDETRKKIQAAYDSGLTDEKYWNQRGVEIEEVAKVSIRT